MKDVEVYKQENEDLRAQNANLKLQLRQGVAAQNALDQSYGFIIREAHSLRTQLILVNDDNTQLKQEKAALEVELDNLKKAVAEKDVNAAVAA